MGNSAHQAFSLRPIEPADQPVLWDILYEALWDPPTISRRPRSVLSNAFIAVYVRDWGAHPADLGFLALAPDASVAGAIWSRLLLPPLQGGSFLDETTPQLGIAVFPAFQRQGIGTALFTQYLPA